VKTLRLCTGRTVHRSSRGIALLFLDHDTRRGWGVSVTPRPLFTPGKDPVPIVQEAGWAPGSVWTGAENLVPIRIRSPDRPARSQLLYRIRYPAYIDGNGKGKVVPVHLMKANRGSRGICPPILTFDTRWRWVVRCTPRPLYPRYALTFWCRNYFFNCSTFCI